MGQFIFSTHGVRKVDEARIFLYVYLLVFLLPLALHAASLVSDTFHKLTNERVSGYALIIGTCIMHELVCIAYLSGCIFPLVVDLASGHHSVVHAHSKRNSESDVLDS